MVVVWHLFCLSILTLSTGVVAVESSSECDVFGTCSQLCSDTENGSYKCSCLEGFQLGPDNRSCTLIDPEWKLIYTTNKGIHCLSQFSNGTEQTTNLANRKLHQEGLTYDARSNVVYWTEVIFGLGTIYKTDISNKSEKKVETVSHIGHAHLRGIAFDWITGNIYFAAPFAHHIGVCRNDTNECAVIVKTENPYDLALHPNQGLMFWTDHDRDGIFRAGMDGTFVQRIVSTNVSGHTGIVVDQGNSRIYWTGYFGSLKTARLDGSDRRVINSISPPVAHPDGIDVLGDTIFWNDDKLGYIRSANKFNGSNAVKYDPVAIHLALAHTANQPILRSNPCQRARNCSHICTLGSNATEFKCFCPVGLTLGNDNRTCVEPQFNATGNTTCSEEQFTCDSGKCIELGFACDGLPNCENNEDEADCGSPVPTDCEWKIDDITTATAKAPELKHENDDDLTVITIVYGSILSIIVFSGVIALVLYTFKKVGTVSEEDRFELLHE